MSSIYHPREDSYLILPEVKSFSRGNVLDVGTGSGILAVAAAEKADNVFAVDINTKALKYANEQVKKRNIKNIRFVHSDLFSYFKVHPWKFDLITFNPPYLPEDLREPPESRIATTGGKKGYEILEKFFSQANNYLMPYGKILIVFSSLTGKQKVEEIIHDYGFEYEGLAEEELFSETLHLYLVEKTELQRRLEISNITNVKKLAKGHRGVIFTGLLNNRRITIKKQREDIEAKGTVENEARWLKVLNRKKIGPRLLFYEKDYFIYNYVKGEFIIPYLKDSTKPEIKKVLGKVFEQCFVLDKLKINKEEMHNPHKHIIIRKNNPVLIDFERTHSTPSPKNVTQFCQFISSQKILKILKDKGFSYNRQKISAAARKYKKSMNQDNLKEILKVVN